MIVQRCGKARVLRFAGLSRFPELVHGVFTREGGTSAAPFDSLNVARVEGEDPACVAANREVLVAWTGGMRLAPLRQVHGAAVHVFDGTAPAPEPPAADAAVTAAAGTALLIQVADCQAVMLYDPKRRVAANVHAGWRGSVANVIGSTVAVMTERFGCRPQDIAAGIGPSLGPCCAEFVHYRREIPEPLWTHRRGEHHFDFWAVSRAQLTAAGVAPERIETAGICTRCRPDLFFSYRHRKRTGRFGAVIGMRPE